MLSEQKQFMSKIKELKIFDKQQIAEIESGLELGVDTQIYTILTRDYEPVYNNVQMRCIKNGLAYNSIHTDMPINISLYSALDASGIPVYTGEQMEVIYAGMEDGVDVSIFANPKYTHQQMWEIEDGLKFNKEHIGSKINVEDYMCENPSGVPVYDSYQMSEIKNGLIYNALHKNSAVDVNSYAQLKDDYTPLYSGYHMSFLRTEMELNSELSK